MATRRRAERDIAARAVASPCAACKVRDISVCSALDADELARLTAIMSTLGMQPQQTLFYEGDPAEFLFNVTGGMIRVHKLLADGRRQVTGFLYPGDFVGLAVHDSYAYTAETVVATSVCRFPRTKLHALMREMPHLENRMLSIASNELIEAQDQMLLLGRKTAQEKIASFLLMISRRAGRRGQPDNPIHLPMGRTDIADFLGLTTETVSRVFTQLKTSGAIRLLDNSRVQLSDMRALGATAQGS